MGAPGENGLTRPPGGWPKSAIHGSLAKENEGAFTRKASLAMMPVKPRTRGTMQQGLTKSLHVRLSAKLWRLSLMGDKTM